MLLPLMATADRALYLMLQLGSIEGTIISKDQVIICNPIITENDLQVQLDSTPCS